MNEKAINGATPATDDFLRDVRQGLAGRPKTLPCKYFYDAEGSRLFDRICELDEYYLTRAELQIMERHVSEMVDLLGPRCMLIEYGSGSSLKTQVLLDHLHEPAAYVPIDISDAYLQESTRRLTERYPSLAIYPVVADYMNAFPVPEVPGAVRRRVVYFPGSTIGNFEPDAATDFLRRIRGVCGEDGGLLIGVDLKKDRETLEAAYNDREGVTAAFNLNILRRVNAELGGEFDLERFRHRAVYDADEGRVEMHIISLEEQRVRLDGAMVSFDAGESICTEYSYKYSIEEFEGMAADAGFERRRTWTDEANRFSVHFMTVRA